MTTVCFRVGCERKSHVLFWLTRKPLLLFRHPCRIRLEEGETIQSIVNYEIIQLPSLRLLNHLSRLFKTLQRKQAIDKLNVSPFRTEAEALVTCFYGLLVLPLLVI
jgi:hypothetical protein